MEDGPRWTRRIAALLGVVVVGGVVLGLIGWAAMGVLPESDAADPDTEVELGDLAAPPEGAEVQEVATAEADDATVTIELCEVIDDVVQVGGNVRNTSGVAQAFVVHVAVLFDGVLFDGQTTDVPVPTVEDGAAADWTAPAGSVDPEDETQVDPECEVDRLGLAEVPAG